MPFPLTVNSSWPGDPPALTKCINFGSLCPDNVVWAREWLSFRNRGFACFDSTTTTTTTTTTPILLTEEGGQGVNKVGEMGLGWEVWGGVGGRARLVVKRFSCCSSGAAMLKICRALALFKERKREEAQGHKLQKKESSVKGTKCMQIQHLQICLVLKRFSVIQLDQWLVGRLHTWHQHTTRGGGLDVGYIRNAQSQNLRAVSLSFFNRFQ